MPRPRGPWRAVQGLVLLFVATLALAGTARLGPASAQDEPRADCSSCTLRHKALLKRRKPAEQCRIKGKIGEAGERIYRLPGGGRYDRSDIDPAKGERWFCTEAEARAAGWKPDRD